MSRLATRLAVLLLGSAPLLAAVSGNPTVFNAGVWVQHPGVAVGQLFASDSRMITVIGDGNGLLHAWYPNGTEVPGFPRDIVNNSTGLSSGGILQPANNFVNSTPALVDINGDGNLEIFVGSGDGFVYGLDRNGNNLPGWPVFTGVSTGDGVYGVFSSPAVADLEGDGTFEVVVGSWSHYIYVWNAENGTIAPGWPFNNADTVWSSPAVADLNGDGSLEIIIGADSASPQGGLLRVFGANGAQMSGWPVFVDQVIWSSPAVDDIDNDGQPEIVVGTGHFYPGKGEYVSAFESNGTPVSGWPASLADGNSSTDNRVFSSPALADVNGDGLMEVFVGSLDGHLYCIGHNGTVQWRNTPPPAGDPANYAMMSSPVVGDIDGDGVFEVVIGGGWHITAFNAVTGTRETGYPIETGYPDLGGTPMFTWSSPSIADIDGDGLIEILIGTGRKDLTGWPDAGGVRAYHEAGSAGSADAGSTGVARSIAPWARFRGFNTGSGSSPDFTTTTPRGDNILSAAASPGVISPNGDGLRDSLRIDFQLGQPDDVTVSILDSTGSVVTNVVSGIHYSTGSHSVYWNGLTAPGTTAVDGQYSFMVSGDISSPVSGRFGVSNTIPEVSRHWFLPEGSTMGFEAFVLIQNPNDVAADVTVTFYCQDGSTRIYQETITPRTRTTVPIHGHLPNTASVSTGVESNVPIVVERAMYFNGGSAAHNSIGVVRTGRRWYFASNRTLTQDEDFILVQNPNSLPTQVTARFFMEDQEPLVQVYSVMATSRFTIPVHGVLPGRRVSVELTSNLPIAAERAFYFASRRGGTSGIGAASPSLTWYFAEGSTTGTDTFLEMFTPGDLDAFVTVDFMRDNGTVYTRNYVVPARRRLTIDVASQIGANRLFSIATRSNAPIVAERLMFAGLDAGDSIGSPVTDTVWNLAEGFTAFGFETWIIVSNPGDVTANVSVNFQTQSGENIVRDYSLPAKRRLTVYANDHVPPTSVSTQVTSDQPIVVERTMKFSNRQGMHQALGVRQ